MIESIEAGQTWKGYAFGQPIKVRVDSPYEADGEWYWNCTTHPGGGASLSAEVLRSEFELVAGSERRETDGR